MAITRQATEYVWNVTGAVLSVHTGVCIGFVQMSVMYLHWFKGYYATTNYWVLLVNVWIMDSRKPSQQNQYTPVLSAALHVLVCLVRL